MGSCNSLNKEKTQKQYKFMLNRIFKCPNGHWLAQFSTPDCSNCSSNQKRISANISCTKCAFSLCQKCYNNKVQKCKKQGKKIKPQVTTQYLEKIKIQFNSTVKVQQENNKVESQYKRFIKYVAQQPTTKELPVSSETLLAEELMKRVIKLTLSEQISTLTTIPSSSQKS